MFNISFVLKNNIIFCFFLQSTFSYEIILCMSWFLHDVLAKKQILIISSNITNLSSALTM